jgi:hypothetical protein
MLNQSLARGSTTVTPRPASQRCSDPSAILDLAALADRNLSKDGVQRLAKHVPQCRDCMHILATLVEEAQPVEATGTHEIEALLAYCRNDSVGRTQTPDK